MTEPGHAPDHAGVIAPPPLIYLAGLAAGLGLEAWWPSPAPIAGAAAYWLGGALIVGAFALVGWAIIELRSAGTGFRTEKATTAIVTSGPYRRSRNPIYIALTSLYLGIAVAAHSLWAVAWLIPVLVVLHYGVIAREERYLERKFGEQYRACQARVRRWL